MSALSKLTVYYICAYVKKSNFFKLRLFRVDSVNIESLNRDLSLLNESTLNRQSIMKFLTVVPLHYVSTALALKKGFGLGNHKKNF